MRFHRTADDPTHDSWPATTASARGPALVFHPLVDSDGGKSLYRTRLILRTSAIPLGHLSAIRKAHVRCHRASMVVFPRAGCPVRGNLHSAKVLRGMDYCGHAEFLTLSSAVVARPHRFLGPLFDCPQIVFLPPSRKGLLVWQVRVPMPLAALSGTINSHHFWRTVAGPMAFFPSVCFPAAVCWRVAVCASNMLKVLMGPRP